MLRRSNRQNNHRPARDISGWSLTGRPDLFLCIACKAEKLWNFSGILIYISCHTPGNLANFS